MPRGGTRRERRAAHVGREPRHERLLEANALRTREALRRVAVVRLRAALREEAAEQRRRAVQAQPRLASRLHLLCLAGLAAQGGEQAGPGAEAGHGRLGPVQRRQHVVQLWARRDRRRAVLGRPATAANAVSPSCATVVPAAGAADERDLTLGDQGERAFQRLRVQGPRCCREPLGVAHASRLSSDTPSTRWQNSC